MDDIVRKAEWQVIGCLLLACFRKEIDGKDFAPAVFEKLEARHFSDWAKHHPGDTARLYAAMVECHKRYGTCEKTSLLKFMTDNKTIKQQDDFMLYEAVRDCGFTYDVEHYARIVTEAYVQRAVKYYTEKGDYTRAQKILAKQTKGGYDL
jgi:replicative DNA helicase